ncbi:arginine/agmatine antiporter (plasmid) [Ensifer sp. PDNC004]|uniref:arginine/agmatine antiporter n=1 Tax=unclassified Ensifer TaxID=2633371 RepID=UPI0017805F7A|nr:MULTISPECIES: arginine/agmatine antiporter [unclassified Ensifer]MBD9650912.1 arginine/agmatine antiporter [Ensifer sp. ENS09]QRY66065.1 arginine/agmatine antiporter [Ensifer sp. PDNC004]
MAVVDSASKPTSAGVAESAKIGLVPATLMVAGNMMGSGVFMLPANLAAVGSIAVFGWLITIAGAIALALTFAKLAAIDPAAGGPYAYTRKAFGDYMGYQTNLIYWLANVVGNVGLAVAGLGYLTAFFPMLRDPLVSALAQVALIWFFTYANILGPNVVGRLQSFTTSFALVPILGMAIFGWFWFSPATFSEGWNVSGKDSWAAIMATLNFTLWAFIGVESASVSAGVVRDPQRNVPIATVGGVILAAVAYILSSTVIMGMIPNKELIASSAPFADAARLALGDTAGAVVAICAALGCLGSLAGWTLLVGQTAKAAADDGLFGSIFAKVNSKGVPSAGLAIVAVIMTVQVFATMSPTASEQFGKIASIAVIMTLLPYIYSAISIKVLGYKKMPASTYNWYVIIGLAAAIYSLVALIGSDGEQTRWSLIFVISTIVFYSAAITRKREIEEKHIDPGGHAPTWIRYVTVTVTVAALVALFWVSVGRHRAETLRTRSPVPPAESTVQPAAGSPAAVLPAESQPAQ